MSQETIDQLRAEIKEMSRRQSALFANLDRELLLDGVPERVWVETVRRGHDEVGLGFTYESEEDVAKSGRGNMRGRLVAEYKLVKIIEPDEETPDA